MSLGRWDGCRPSRRHRAMSMWSMSHEAERAGEMRDTMIGVDLAKRVFHVHGASMRGQVKFRKKLTREQFRRFMAGQRTCVVVFEACGSAHYWAREIRSADHHTGPWLLKVPHL